MVDVVLLHELQALLQAHFRAHGQQITAHHLRDLDPRRTLVFRRNLVGNIALGDDPDKSATTVDYAGRTHFFGAQILRGFEHSLVFSNGIDFRTGPDQIRHSHWTLRARLP